MASLASAAPEVKGEREPTTSGMTTKNKDDQGASDGTGRGRGTVANQEGTGGQGQVVATARLTCKGGAEGENDGDGVLRTRNRYAAARRWSGKATRPSDGATSRERRPA